MEFGVSFLLFFSGVLSYMLGIRIFKTWSKVRLYKITYINCLIALRFADVLAQDVLKASEPQDEKQIEEAFELWREMALVALNTKLPDPVWKEISINKWSTAMRTIEKLEKKAGL